jgi:hypothetical protein
VAAVWCAANAHYPVARGAELGEITRDRVGERQGSMKKTKANGKSHGKSQPQQHDKGTIHVRLYLTMLETPAWRSLDGNARALYIEIAARYRGNNNGKISFSMREASRALHSNFRTALRKFRQLQQRGFIVEAVKGSYGGQRSASRWRLTEFNCDVTGESATADFMRWRNSHDANRHHLTDAIGPS